MKKLVLTLIILFCTTSIVVAQQSYNIEEAQKIAAENGTPLIGISDKESYYFDPEQKSYLPKKEFIEKYGRPALRQLTDIEEQRRAKEEQAKANIEREKLQLQALERLMNLDSYKSVSYNKNEYADILDGLDGEDDGIIDYLSVATFFRDNIAGIDKNGNISMMNIIEAPRLYKEQIYIQANSWFVHTFNSGKSVIQLNEKEAGTILAKGYLKNIAEQVGFAISYEISANVIFRIDIKDGKARLITTIQEYESINRGGVAGAMSGNVSPSLHTCGPETVFPFVDKATTLSKKAGAKAYCACCMYMIAMKNQLKYAINSGIIGDDVEDW